MSTDHPFHNNVESKHEKGPKGQRFPCSMSSNIENNGSFTLLIRLDVYMTNNPLECTILDISL